MEKRAVIQPGVTPPEQGNTKEASGQPTPDQLAEHVTKRAADAVKQPHDPTRFGR